MKRVMCLRILNWPVQRLQRLLPAEQRANVAVHTLPLTASSSTSKTSGRRSSAANDDLRFVRQLFPSARSGPAVICASPDAWAAGVRLGMPLAEARSMIAPVGRTATNGKATRRTQKHRAAETHFVEWSPSDDRKDLTALAELTRRFAPIVGLDEMPVPDSLLLNISGCGQLFGGESSLAEQLVQHISQQALNVRVSISDSVATAWAFAHADGHFLQAVPGHNGRTRRNARMQGTQEWKTPIVIIPPGQSESWLHKLPVAAARIPLDDADVLAQLGILTLRQLLGLPIEDLPSRLSDMAIRRIRQLRGIDDEIITAIAEADPVTASWTSEFPACGAMEIRQVLQQLVSEISGQLTRRFLGAVKLNCQLIQENGVAVPLAAEAVQPVQDGDHLLEVVQLQLERLRITLPIQTVNIQAVVAPLPTGRQKNLFDSEDHIQPGEDLAVAINRLTNRLGRNSVLKARPCANPLSEHAVQLSPLIDPQGNGDLIQRTLDDLISPGSPIEKADTQPGRPVRLFLRPVAIDMDGVAASGGSFHWNGQQHSIVSAVGPERLQTQWWHDESVHRDYYRVITSSGSQLWIYRNISTGQWYLHGVFD